MGARVMVIVLALAQVMLMASPSTARAEDPPYVPWSDLVPGLSTEHDPSSENLCTRGDIRCIDSLIKEMQRRFDALAKRCDHDAVFALTYLRTTEQFRISSTTSGFYQDPPFMNHWAAVFGKLYLDWYDAWHAGRKSEVPEAWRVAFRAADTRAVSAAGNLQLGMSAHINRDLPFVLESIGQVAPDGSSRKPDHDAVNRFLNRVTDIVIPEIARRFDPSISITNVPGTKIDSTVLFQLVQGWREVAWRNGELLSADADVGDTIEAAAATEAAVLKLGTQYSLGQSSASRDAYCAEHWRD
jgi:hypothetical protein